jgi:hypothetical protein
MQGPRLAESNGETIVAFAAQDYDSTGKPGFHQHKLSSTEPLLGSQGTESYYYNSPITLLPGFEFLASNDYFLSSVQFQDGANTFFDILTVKLSNGDVGGSTLYLPQTLDYLDLHGNTDGNRAAITHCGPDGYIIFSWGSFADHHNGTRDYAYAVDGAGDVCASDADAKQTHLVDTAEETYSIFKTKDGEEELTKKTGINIVPYDIDIFQEGNKTYLVGALGSQGLYVAKDNSNTTFVVTADPFRARIAANSTSFYVVYSTEGGDAYLVYGDLSGATEVKLATGLSNVEDVDVFLTADDTLVIAVLGDDALSFTAYQL